MSIRTIINGIFHRSLKHTHLTPSIVKSQTPTELAKDIIHDKLAALKDINTERRFVVFPSTCKTVDVVRLCIIEGYYPRWIIQENDVGRYAFYERLTLKSGTRVAYPAKPWLFSSKGELVRYVYDRYNGEYIVF